MMCAATVALELHCIVESLASRVPQALIEVAYSVDEGSLGG